MAWSSRLRCWAAMSSEAAWWTTPTYSCGTTNSVRRMASIRTSARSSYITRAMSFRLASGHRASSDR